MKTRHRILLVIILIISVLVRIGAVFIMGDQVVELPGTSDQISYHNLALRVINGYGFTFGQNWWPATKAGEPTAHWSYLYTFYLVIVYTIFGPHPLVARLIQAFIVGILHPYLAYLLGNRLFPSAGKIAGLIAASWTTFYTYFIYYSSALMTESFYITVILGSLYLSISLVESLTNKSAKNWQLYSVSLGLMLGLAVLLRQLYLLFIPFLFAWIWWATRSKRRFAIKTMAISGIIVLAIILPFTLYNYSRFHRFVLLNNNAGYAFYWANHPYYGTHFIPILPSEKYTELLPIGLEGLDEAALDQELLHRGIQFVLDDPVRYMLLSLSRIPSFFEFWPSLNDNIISNIARVGGFGILLPFVIYGLILAVVKEAPGGKTISIFIASPMFLIMLFSIFYTILHLLIWALIRYRLPVDAVLILFSGPAVIDVSGRIHSKLVMQSQTKQTVPPGI